MEFKKIEKIDSGGFGTVYKAMRSEDKTEFALKELSPQAITDAEKKRFIREVRMQSQLKHKNIVPIFYYDLNEDHPWFVMPLASKTLRQGISDLTDNPQRALRIFSQILDGIQYAHDNGVVHRDLKPENILFFDDLNEEDLVKISDFGLGKRLEIESITITQSTDAGLGTFVYMPPEQINNLKHVDERGDIFSLGKMLYELLTGQLPLHVNTRHQKIKGGYAFIISKCLEPAPSDRYQSVKDLRDDLLLLSDELNRFQDSARPIKDILNSILGQSDISSDVILDLDEYLRQNALSESIYLEYFPKLPKIVVEKYYQFHRRRFLDRLRTFDSYLGRKHPFGYTDTVADFYKVVYQLTDELEIKRLILSRLMDLAYWHHRWHVRDIFCQLISSIKDSAEALMARDVLLANRTEASWCAEDCLKLKMPIILKDALQSMLPKEPDESSL